ncbi:31434_t:CDS:2 [Racocetra persica]|uniref:31434_t:CDS:1 n=1 Tax=Racocetra persica TaxID=160502 RepID=A0ACA9MIF4_9GLOM|nr:31434_t:CDS:2 [Racocetra persica]
MGIHDLEKEIHRILQDSSKIRGYNAKLRSEYIKLNDENRRLKVENSKLISQSVCAEISLAKSKADNFAKSEEVKSLQSVINLLAPRYSDNNQSDSLVAGSEKIDEPEGVNTSSTIIPNAFPEGLDSSIQEQKNNSMNLKTVFPEPILPATSTNKISLGGAEGMGSQRDLAKPSAIEYMEKN